MQSKPTVVHGYSSPPWSGTLRLVVGVILITLLVLGASAIRLVLVPLVVGAIIAYLVHPAARFTSRALRLSHELATAIVYLLLLGAAVPVFIFAGPLLVRQVTALQAELITFLNDVEAAGARSLELLPGFEVRVQDLVDEVAVSLRDLVRTAARESVNLLVGASKTLLLAIFTIFIAYYLTADGHRFVNWSKSLIPTSYRHDVGILLGDINEIWKAFFRGQVILALTVTAIVTALSFAIGLPQPLLMGVLAGLLEFLVSVGHTIWLIVALIVALVEGSTYLPVSNWVFALIVIGTNLLFTKFDLNFLIPKIVGSRMHLHPMVVIVGIVVGATVGGVLGIALAAPTIASLRVIGRYLYFKFFEPDPIPEAGALVTSAQEDDHSGEQVIVPTS